MSGTSSARDSENKRALSHADYERFAPLVSRIAMRVARKVPSHIALSDLMSYGWLGLVEAFSRANEGMPENEFEAYALYRIRGAMLDYLRSLDPTTRDTRKASKRLSQAIATLSQRLGRSPTEGEIAAELGLDEGAYASMLERVEAAGMSRLELLDIESLELASTLDRPDEDATRRDLMAAVAEAIEQLPERLQHVIALYYQEECTLREIGMVLELSEARICQLHTEAIHRLRAAIGRE